MEKNFYVMTNVGKSRYVINFHDGVSAHKDGSPFYGIDICPNKKVLKKRLDALRAIGYKERIGYFSPLKP